MMFAPHVLQVLFQPSLLRPSDPHLHQFAALRVTRRVEPWRGVGSGSETAVGYESGALTPWLGRASRPPVGQVTSVPRWDVTSYPWLWLG